MCEESRIDKVVLQYIPVPYYSRLYKRCCVANHCMYYICWWHQYLCPKVWFATNGTWLNNWNKKLTSNKLRTIEIKQHCLTYIIPLLSVTQHGEEHQW